MKARISVAALLFFVPAILTGAACSSSSDSNLGKVSGTVTLDGQPYPNAQVVFNPESGRPSLGITNSQGEYELSYTPTEKGAMLGKHAINITTIPEVASDRAPRKRFKEIVPKKYNQASTLSALVEKGVNEHNFSLLSK